VIDRIHSMRWTIGLSILAGLFLSGGFTYLGALGLDLYDAANPVLELNGTIKSLDNDSIVVHAEGEKVRNCQYIRLQAYTLHADGRLHDAQIERVDQHEDHDHKVKGAFDFGTWRIWPKGDAVGLQVFSQHLCSNRMVMSKIFDMKLIKG